MAFNHNHRFKLKLIDLSDNTTVAHAPTSNTQTLQPASGKIYEIIKIFIYIPDPAGSAAGTHELIMHHTTDGSSVYGTFLLRATTGNSLGTYYSAFTADSAEAPGEAITQGQILNGFGDILCSYTYPIYFKYTNSTDVDQSGTRVIKVLVKEYNEGD